MVDVIYRNLQGSSVHQASWPLGIPGSLEGATADTWDEDAAKATATLPPQDLDWKKRMALVRELAETGRRFVLTPPGGRGYHVAMAGLSRDLIWLNSTTS